MEPWKIQPHSSDYCATCPARLFGKRGSLRLLWDHLRLPRFRFLLRKRRERNPIGLGETVVRGPDSDVRRDAVRLVITISKVKVVKLTK